MAMLTAIAMALVADFLLLPALLIKLDSRKPSGASAHAGVAEFAPAR